MSEGSLENSYYVVLADENIQLANSEFSVR
ncbi:hypothetical protein bb8_p08 [Bordetella phage vB_BbrP_BB8]|uniref:Uncharacterized protein n=1 Tax=Bordetella phage vB_BbrP_BB8 TaxID=2587820 RepID=A0A4Y5TPU3_9CAUD|nr:hypothetical protein bb8_p08 [Bordetella phage vB_BbrP_BB8]